MMIRRGFNRRPGLHRQLMYDPSPRKGVEIFACREPVTQKGNLRACVNRKLPMTSLGVGHFSLADKIMALLHSLLLEVYPSREDIDYHMRTVRIVLPDSGGERLIVDGPDLTEVARTGRREQADIDACRGTYLFPLAIWIPESNHVWDLILRSVLKRIIWFDELKCVAAFVPDDANEAG